MIYLLDSPTNGNLAHCNLRVRQYLSPTHPQICRPIPSQHAKNAIDFISFLKLHFKGWQHILNVILHGCNLWCYPTTAHWKGKPVCQDEHILHSALHKLQFYHISTHNNQYALLSCTVALFTVKTNRKHLMWAWIISQIFTARAWPDHSGLAPASTQQMVSCW
jgi:hypothetical protein